jgi:hypothetical protein
MVDSPGVEPGFQPSQGCALSSWTTNRKLWYPREDSNLHVSTFEAWRQSNLTTRAKNRDSRSRKGNGDSPFRCRFLMKNRTATKTLAAGNRIERLLDGSEPSGLPLTEPAIWLGVSESNARGELQRLATCH